MERVCAVSKLRRRRLVHAFLSTGADVVLTLSRGGPGGEEERVLAVSNTCPHKAAGLCNGDIEDGGACDGGGGGGGGGGGVGPCVKCPRHRKKFNGGLTFSMVTGEASVGLCPDGGLPPEFDPRWRLGVYSAAISGDDVLVSRLPVTEGVAGRAAGEGAGWEEWRLARIDPQSPDAEVYTLEPGPALRSVPLPEDVDPWCWHVCVRLPLHLRAAGEILSAAGATTTTDAGVAAAAAAAASSSSSSGETTAAREYTPLNPVSDWAARRPLRLLIRRYTHGALTGRLSDARVGDAWLLSAVPRTTLTLPECREQLPAMPAGPAARRLCLIAGGTGVAPMMQLIAAAAADGPWARAGVRVRVQLLIYSRREADVLMRRELEGLMAAHSAWLQVRHVVTRPEGDWTGATGRVCESHVRWFVGDGVDDAAATTRVVSCGPPGFNASVLEALRSLGSPELPPDSAVLLDA